MLFHFDIEHLGFFTALAAALFLAIVFIQSGLDKVFDYKGNRDFLKSHFSKTFLGGMVGLLLPLITLLELGGGLLCVAGIITSLIDHEISGWLLFYGFIALLLALAALMFGQRVAKDYAGAGGLTGYIIITLIGFYALLA